MIKVQHPLSIPSDRPLVSIGMPVYNGGKTIRAAIDSILAQSYRNLELIISDNASTDDTASICNELTQTDSRIRYVRQVSNLGAVANFSFVLSESVGEFFMWAAADDLRSEGCIEFYLNHIGQKGLVFTTYASYCFDAKVSVCIPLKSYQERDVNAIAAAEYIKRPTPSYIYGMFRRHDLERNIHCLSVPFDWSDIYLVTNVILSSGVSQPYSARPMYFAGYFSHYIAKPVGGRFIRPFPYAIRAAVLSKEIGVAAVQGAIRVILLSYYLNIVDFFVRLRSKIKV
jgi:glycosyltransferase involved in cell wall biosynthesis